MNRKAKERQADRLLQKMKDPTTLKTAKKKRSQMTISSTEQIEKGRKIGKQNRKQGDDYEDFIERRLHLTKQRGSGCGPVEKEDLVGKDPRGTDIMAQVKSHSGKAITIKVEELERVVKHAADCKVYEDGNHVSDGREPVWIIGIVGGTFYGPRDWVLVPLEEWEKYE